MNVPINLLTQLYDLTALRSDSIEFFDALTRITSEFLNAEYSVIALYDKVNNELYYSYVSGSNEAASKSIDADDENFCRIKIGEGILGSCAKEHGIVNLKKPEKDSRFRPCVDQPYGWTIRSVLAVPMFSRNQLIGIIEAINKQKAKAFTRRDEAILKFIASQAAIQMDNETLFQENINLGHLSDLGQGIVNSAHGLKNILNNMDGATYIVERGVFKKNMDNVNKGWDILKRNSQRLRDLVLEILLFSRPQKLNYECSDLNRICKDLVELIHQNAAQSGVKLKLQMDPQIESVYIDPKAIYRCLLNLMSNAIHTCKKKGGGKVNLITRKQSADTFQIIVTDTGQGISKANLEHIFDVFFSTKGAAGTGLGLPVCKKIVSEHKGAIEVDSEENVGTTFTITLPVIKENINST